MASEKMRRDAGIYNGDIMHSEVAARLGCSETFVRRYRKDKNVSLTQVARDSARKAMARGGFKGRKPLIATNLKSGEEIWFDSLIVAAKQLNVNVGNMCSCLMGQVKSAGGYIFRYSDNPGP